MKNPFISLWLSYANSYANMLRGCWMGEIQRQQTMMMNAMIKSWLSLWGVPSTSASPRRRTRK